MDAGRKRPGLGCFQLCLPVKDLAASEAFYAGLGFAVKEDGRSEGFLVMRREDCEVGLFAEHVEAPLLNFRGGNTHDLARWLADLGLPMDMNKTNEADGSGSVIVKDPDGHTLFFDSTPAEVQAYATMRPHDRRLDPSRGRPDADAGPD